MTTSIRSQSYPGLNHACRSYCRSHSLFLNRGFSLALLKDKNLNKFGGLTSDKVKRKFVVCSNPLPPPPSPSPFNGWLVGILLSLILPFLRNKWGPLLHLKQWAEKVEDVIETVDEVVEEVEKVAEEVDKIEKEIVNDLPEGQLKDAAIAVENFTEKIAKFAHAADDFIDKVQEVEHKAEEGMESLVESFPDEVNRSTISKIGDIDTNPKK